MKQRWGIWWCFLFTKYSWEKRNEKSGQMFNSRRFLSVVETNGSGAEETFSLETCAARRIHIRSLLKQIFLTRFSLN